MKEVGRRWVITISKPFIERRKVVTIPFIDKRQRSLYFHILDVIASQHLTPHLSSTDKQKNFDWLNRNIKLDGRSDLGVELDLVLC